MSSQAQAAAADGREAIEHLGKIKFFAGLPAAYLRRIADIGAEEVHNGGSTIFSEGDKGDKFYLILDGAVRISRMVPGMGEEALAVLLRSDKGVVGVRDGTQFVGVLTPNGIHQALRASLAEPAA